ncbi:MAG: galactokinase [Chloroflexi bacterium]|nr:galactokinase [Chloroflexota bacterium]
MIITRAPLRLPLGGGGTDLPAFYSRYGGHFVSATINKYVYILINPRFEDSIRISYSKTEIVDTVDEIEHPIVREAMRLVGVDRGVEIVSVADMPANTGLGSSGTFTVALLHALHTLKREQLPPQDLAEEAFHIEAEILGEPVGKQDQYIAAIGGICSMEIDKQGHVRVKPLSATHALAQEFENSVLLFYTGLQRRASDVLSGQNAALTAGAPTVTESLTLIKELGHQSWEALENGDLNRFGEILHLHWEAKRRMSDKISGSQIDNWYNIARENGATGGKIVGAGGGGFLMLYCENGVKPNLREAMTQQGLHEMPYHIDFEGSKVIINF